MSKYVIHPHGVCSREIEVEFDEEGVLTGMRVVGGCAGNLQGISRLVVGRRAEEVAALLEGIDCGGKGTSCPDQLARGLRAILKQRSVD